MIPYCLKTWIRNTMYVAMFMIGLGLLVIGVLYLVLGDNTKATYYIIGFIIAEILALAFKYCSCCCGTDSTDGPDYSSFYDEPTAEQRRKQEIYNNEPYSALLAKPLNAVSMVSTSKQTSVDRPFVSPYNSSTRLVETLSVGKDSFHSQYSYGSNGFLAFPVVRSSSMVSLEDSEPLYQSVNGHMDHYHKSVSRYNSFQSNSLPTDLRQGLFSSCNSFDTAISPAVPREKS